MSWGKQHTYNTTYLPSTHRHLKKLGHSGVTHTFQVSININSFAARLPKSSHCKSHCEIPGQSTELLTFRTKTKQAEIEKDINVVNIAKT